MTHHHCLACRHLTPRDRPFCPECLRRILELLLA
jgi:RNA polymerase subunit RPABC4/transcription elongation factor Spt4